MDTSKATGPDGIVYHLLKEAAPSISDILSKIFTASLRQSSFPNIWKTARVIPLHKKGCPTDSNNYRPVSLLCCVSKVFERAVYQHAHEYLISNNLITHKQSGFTSGDSTKNQLTGICPEIYRAFDEGDEIRAVFLDFSKAFDKVWHRGLSYKLEQVGIKGNLLKWFGSYLSGRQQAVILNGSKSSYRHVETNKALY